MPEYKFFVQVDDGEFQRLDNLDITAYKVLSRQLETPKAVDKDKQDKLDGLYAAARAFANVLYHVTKLNLDDGKGYITVSNFWKASELLIEPLIQLTARTERLINVDVPREEREFTESFNKDR